MRCGFTIKVIPTNRRKRVDWTNPVRLSAFLCLIFAIPLQARAGDLHDAAQAGDVETVTTFLALPVEFVEALTIVLAVEMVRGWRLALASASGGGARLDRKR